MLFFLPKSSEITPYPRIYIVFFDNSPVVFCVAGLVGILKGCSNIMKPEHLETLMVKSLNSVSVSLKLVFYVSHASKILPRQDSILCRGEGQKFSGRKWCIKCSIRVPEAWCCQGHLEGAFYTQFFRGPHRFRDAVFHRGSTAGKTQRASNMTDKYETCRMCYAKHVKTSKT